MARPIQNTPILKGEDARRFRKDLLKAVTRKLTPEERRAKDEEIRKMESSYDLMVSISDGAFY